MFSGSWDHLIICWNSNRKTHPILKVIDVHKSIITSFSNQNGLDYFYSIGHDYNIYQFSLKKVILEKKFKNFFSNGSENVFFIDQFHNKLYGIDASTHNQHLIKLSSLSKEKYEYIYCGISSILCFQLVSKMNILFIFKKDLSFSLMNTKSKKIWKQFPNFFTSDINSIKMESNQKFILVSSQNEDKLKIIFNKNTSHIQDLHIKHNSISASYITKKKGLIFLGDKKKNIISVKYSNVKNNSSSFNSGSASFESFKTLSSNDLEKKKNEILERKNSEFRITYGSNPYKRRITDCSDLKEFRLRKSIFGHQKSFAQIASKNSFCNMNENINNPGVNPNILKQPEKKILEKDIEYDDEEEDESDLIGNIHGMIFNDSKEK